MIQLNVVRIFRINTGEHFNLNHFLFGDHLLAYVRIRVHPLDARIQFIQLVASARLDKQSRLLSGPFVEWRFVLIGSCQIGAHGRDHVVNG